MFRVPSYVYDVHTYIGKKHGKTRLDFFIDENKALEPRQISLFDQGSFCEYYQWNRDAGIRLDPAYDQRWKDYMADLLTKVKGKNKEPDNFLYTKRE